MRNPSIPIIGITCRGTRKPLRLQHLYGNAIIRAGGRPEYIYPDVRFSIPIDMLGGILIPGGRDIDPRRYGQRCSDGLDLEEESRTEFELNLLDAVLKYNKPVFGICYGMQLINIYHGGSLIQDIRRELPQVLDHSSGCHEIKTIPNPFIPQGDWTVNSSHHQAVRNPGAGLLPAAFSPDGIIEALYSDLPGFLVGVQWHPERVRGPLSDLLLQRFVSASQHR